MVTILNQNNNNTKISLSSEWSSVLPQRKRWRRQTSVDPLGTWTKQWQDENCDDDDEDDIGNGDIGKGDIYNDNIDADDFANGDHLSTLSLRFAICPSL